MDTSSADSSSFGLFSAEYSPGRSPVGRSSADSSSIELISAGSSVGRSPVERSPSDSVSLELVSVSSSSSHHRCHRWLSGLPCRSYQDPGHLFVWSYQGWGRSFGCHSIPLLERCIPRLSETLCSCSCLFFQSASSYISYRILLLCSGTVTMEQMMGEGGISGSGCIVMVG